MEENKFLFKTNNMNANQLFGYQIIEKQLLENFRSGRLHHALLFCGNKGIGKSNFTKNLAKIIVGNSTSISFENNPDILLIERDETKRDIAVDLIRKITDFTNLTSAFSSKRIIIIDAIDEMNKNASNALLKILEEPNENIFFLLINHNSNKTIPTIKSRCRIIKIKPPKFEDFVSALKSLEPTITLEEIKDLFVISSGSIGLALEFYKYKGLEIYSEFESVITNDNEIKIIDFLGKISDKNLSWIVPEQVINLYLITKTKELTKNNSNLNSIFAITDQINKLLLEVKNLNSDKKHSIINIINLLKSI